MECKVCNSSKLVLVALGIVIAMLAYKLVVVKEQPVTTIVELKEAAEAINASNKNHFDRQDIELIIKEYIINHPEDIVRALEVIQKQNLRAVQEATEKLIQDNIKDVNDTSSALVFGNKNGTANIVYFYDYNCSYCIKQSEILQELAAKHSNIKLIYKPLPFLGEGSEYLAKVMLAVSKLAPSKALNIHTELLSQQISSTQEVFDTLKKAGVNAEEVMKLSHENEINDKLVNNLQLAKVLNISGVPTSIVGNKFFTGLLKNGQLEDILNSIDLESKKAIEHKTEEQHPATVKDSQITQPAHAENEEIIEDSEVE